MRFYSGLLPICLRNVAFPFEENNVTSSDSRYQRKNTTPGHPAIFPGVVSVCFFAFVCLVVCLFVCLFVCWFVCLFVCLCGVPGVHNNVTSPVVNL